MSKLLTSSHQAEQERNEVIQWIDVQLNVLAYNQ